MKITILPKTRLGYWSLGLAVGFIAIFVAADTLIGSGPASISIKVLSIIMASIAGVSFVIGLLSMIKHKERSLLVLLGMVITFWVGLLGGISSLIISAVNNV